MNGVVWKKKNRENLKYAIIFTSTVLSIIANVIAVKIIQIGPMYFTGGVMLFPIIYIFNDIVAECYGYKDARNMTLICFVYEILVAGVFFVIVRWPHAPFWNEQEAFSRILGVAPRLTIAGLLGFLAGSLINAKIVEKMKLLMHERLVWVRLVVSTFVGELVDTSIFILLGFAFTISRRELLYMIFSQTGVKVLLEIIITPVTCFIIRRMNQYGEQEKTKIM